jgi:1A family penicillin-binding protein
MGKSLKRILAIIGKPFYFLLSHLLIGLIAISIVINKPAKKNKKNKKQKTKIIYKKGWAPELKLPKISFPKIKLPKVSPILKLEELKIDLFELKIWTRIKNSFKKAIKFIADRKLKHKIRFILITFFGLALVLTFYFSILKGLPSPKELEVRQPDVSTKIYDRNGNLLYKIYKNQNRTIVPLDKIPTDVRLATLAAEDAEFYSNPGFSVRGMFRASIQDIETGSLQGGSTITQQLVKNTLLSPEKTITRKIKEIILSVEVEAVYTKDQILEMYLNQVSYGGTAYGVQEASELYFGKNVEDLDLAEAALLAGLPKSPTTYSPFGSNPDLAIQRQREVLHLMVVNKFISESQAEAAEQEKLTFIPNKTAIEAPHFVMYIRQLLVDKYGEDMVEKGGLEVTTSLDLSIQKTAEEVVQSEVDKLKGLKVGNGAALVLNPQTGEILAMVGSKDYFDLADDGNVNVTTSLRQPGSSIKVVNYAYALDNGYTPASIIDDSPITFSMPGTTPYFPVNYDGKYVGQISLRNALAQSRNIPAVKVLASYGVSHMITEGQKMGITTWGDPSNYGLSLTLGGGAVTALDLSRVYSTVADYGKRPDLLPILEVKDYKGKVLEKDTPTTTQAIDPRIAFLLTDILKDNNARAPEFGYNSYLVIKNHPEIAVKTGTSNDLRDNWTVGYNQNYLVLTWVGNNDNSPMSYVASGVTGASPIWNKIMSAILLNQSSIDWKVPDGVSKVNICSLTGTLPCDSCPTRQEWFLDENRPSKSCTPDQIQQITNPSPTPGESILENGASTQIKH